MRAQLLNGKILSFNCPRSGELLEIGWMKAIAEVVSIQATDILCAGKCVGNFTTLKIQYVLGETDIVQWLKSEEQFVVKEE